MASLNTPAATSPTPAVDHVASLEQQARQLEMSLYMLFIDYDACVRRGETPDLPPAVAGAMLQWHPFAEQMRERIRTQMQVLSGHAPAPFSNEAQNQVHRRIWSLGAEDVPEIVLTPGRRTNVDWVVAVVASCPEVSWTAAQVLDVLRRNGWTTNSPHPQNLVANALARAAEQHASVIRDGRGVYTWKLTSLSAPEELPGDLPGESWESSGTTGVTTEEAAMS